jgi:hypothetical protein
VRAHRRRHDGSPAPWSAGAPASQPHGGLLGLQRAAGNAVVSHLVSGLREASLAEIAKAEDRRDVLRLRAGTPAAQAPPDGLNAIQSRSSDAAGWTGTRMGAAFVNPDLHTTWIRPSAPGGDHYVTVDSPDPSPDAVHESLYPAPGDHRWGTGTIDNNGVPFTAWHRVTRDMSNRIQSGEQEHLDDSARAYDLTYGLITRTIQSMTGQRFGPASSPTAAEQLARDGFDRQVPAPLRTSQPAYRGAWLAMLETLLRQTKLRDTRGWHDVEHASTITQGHRFVYPLEETAHTRIGSVPSDQVVNYPATNP